MLIKYCFFVYVRGSDYKKSKFNNYKIPFCKEKQPQWHVKI